jgi:hypothetical protein
VTKKATVALKEYLKEVSKDPGKQEMLRREPKNALKDVEISDSEAKEALVSGNWGKARKLLGDKFGIIIYEQASVTLDDFIRALDEHGGGLVDTFMREPAGLLAHLNISEQGRQMLLEKNWTRISQERGGKPLPSALDEAVNASQNSKT